MYPNGCKRCSRSKQNGLRTKTKMRDRLRARLVRVVDEVPLRVESRVLRDDLHAVFIRTDRSVRAQSVEDAPGDRVLLDGEARIDFETSVRHIVVDADRETILG